MTEGTIFAGLIGTYFFLRASSPEWPQGHLELPKLGLDCPQFSKFTGIGELRRLDVPVRVLGEDQCIDHADGPGVDQRQQLCRHLTGEVARSRRELDDDVVNGT